jgi:4-aminobutyrate aminotransferase-like enzyme
MAPTSVLQHPAAAPSRAQALAQRKKRVLMPSVGHFFPDDPIQLVRGLGAKVWDIDGREYLDFASGIATTNLGHCHPEVTAATIKQLQTLQHVTTIHLTEPMIALAERLLEKAPAGLSRVFFCVDGSGANEGAMIAARVATGRPDFLALEGGLHGRTSLTMAATGLPMWRADPFPAAKVHRLWSPQGRSAEDCADELRQVLEAAEPRSVAALIAEPVQGNGGIVVPPAGYFQAMKRALDDFGVLLIVDEAQTGFCRTGRWFGIEHWGVSPDLMTVAKALANGLPAAAWLCREEIAQACASRPMASTFGGNLAPMAAGLKVMEILERDGIAERAASLGKRLLQRLEEARSFHHSERVADVRGLGLMAGVECDGPDLAEAILWGMRRRGVLACKGGARREVVEFLPPLIVTEAQIDQAADAFASALQEALEAGQ